MRFGLALPSYSFADLDYEKAARLRVLKLQRCDQGAGGERDMARAGGDKAQRLDPWGEEIIRHFR